MSFRHFNYLFSRSSLIFGKCAVLYFNTVLEMGETKNLVLGMQFVVFVSGPTSPLTQAAGKHSEDRMMCHSRFIITVVFFLLVTIVEACQAEIVLCRGGALTRCVSWSLGVLMVDSFKIIFSLLLFAIVRFVV